MGYMVRAGSDIVRSREGARRGSVDIVELKRQRRAESAEQRAKSRRSVRVVDGQQEDADSMWGRESGIRNRATAHAAVQPGPAKDSEHDGVIHVLSSGCS
jgi:hypothetical protein